MRNKKGISPENVNSRSQLSLDWLKECPILNVQKICEKKEIGLNIILIIDSVPDYWRRRIALPGSISLVLLVVIFKVKCAPQTNLPWKY